MEKSVKEDAGELCPLLGEKTWCVRMGCRYWSMDADSCQWVDPASRRKAKREPIPA